VGQDQDSSAPGTGDAILHRVESGVSWITLNRPTARNALTADQRTRLVDLLNDASADFGVRVVVITATGTSFCAGMDIRLGRVDTARRAPDVPERVAGDVAHLVRIGVQTLIAAVLDCEKPVIAAVNGIAAGFGAHLAFACDLVLAAEEATFVEAFVRRGLVPDGGGAYLLPRLVGPAKAKELLFFGDALSANDAARLGLVNRVVPGIEVEAVAREWAERLAAGPTRSLGLTKWLVNHSLDSDRATAFRDESVAIDLNMFNADAREGIDAFTERRDPIFRGW
jgi:2-(1,2-epoxy-1,2-dihydrophenyl)acetyl-CoA isomerase